MELVRRKADYEDSGVLLEGGWLSLIGEGGGGSGRR